MIQDEKILVTGVTGVVAAPIAKFLARDNEVWGLSRFLDAKSPAREGKEVPRIGASNLQDRATIESLGIRPCAVDLSTGDLADVPNDFTYVLHFAFARIPPGADQFERAFRVNADGTGFILKHCRKAKAALVVSSGTIYAPNPDPDHAYHETDPLGGAKAYWSPSSPASKLFQEAVAGFCARAFDLPTTIVRLFMPYGMPGVTPSLNVEALKRGEAIFMQNGPQPHTLIHIDDICEQLEPMLGSAGVPPLTVNWGGDEIVSTRDWCEMAGRLLGIEPKFDIQQVPDAHGGFIGDANRRKEITGPCRVKFAEGFEQLVRTHHS
jgi:nucleoside-diphosphate-sugar epimerase